MELSSYTLHPESEPQIEVNLDTREIIVPPELQDIAVTGDNNAETIYIKVNHTFDGIDLSDKRFIIYFENAKKETSFTEITDIDLSDTNYIILGWKIDSRLTKYQGKAKFKLSFESENYSLNTLPGEFNILQSLDFHEVNIDPNESVYQQLTRRISDLEIRVSELVSKSGEMEQLSGDLTELKQKVSDLNDTLNFVRDNVFYRLN